MKRRDFLKLSALNGMAGLGALGMLSSLDSNAASATNDYRALVCVFLVGGNDGHNTLLPLDAAYSDYAKARPTGLALAKDSLVSLNGSSAGHTFGPHPALSPLASLYNQRRLAWVANAGPLIVPSTAQQVINRTVPIPPYLMSHSDQIAMQQGWGGDIEPSGWAGRGMELLPNQLVNKLSMVTMTNHKTLVRGRNSAVSFLDSNGSRNLGRADLARPEDSWTQLLNSMARWQFGNQYATEYTRTFRTNFDDGTLFTKALMAASTPQANFGSDDLATKLRTLASVLPVFKSLGYRRQVFLVSWGSFATQSGQRGSVPSAQDPQLDIVARAVAAFDQANIAAGLDKNVTTLMMSDFGRTLRPASGEGTDHAWGNHWFVMGGNVTGGQVFGSFPSLVLGGADDADPGRGGRMVPSTSTDQVGATVMKWMGLNDLQLNNVFPNLKNFSTRDLGFITA